MRDLCFGDPLWTLRSIVANTGNGLPGGEVLMTRANITPLVFPDGRVSVNMTKEQSENAAAYSNVQVMRLERSG